MIRYIIWTSLTLLLSTGSSFGVKPPVTAAAVAPNDRSVLIGSQSGLRELTWPQLKPARTIPTKLDHIHAIAFAPHGKSVAVAGGSPADAGIVEIYAWPQVKLLHRATVQDDLITSIAWHPKGNQLASGSADTTCALLSSKTGKVIRRFTGHSRSVMDVIYLPDGKHLVSTGIDRSVRYWSSESAKQIRSLDNHTKSIVDMALRPADPDTLPMVASVSEDRTVRLWQPTIGRMVRFLRLPGQPLQVAWTTDGSHLLITGRDGKLRKIDPDSLKIIKEIKATSGWAYTLAVGTKGAMLVGGANGELKMIPPILP